MNQSLIVDKQPYPSPNPKVRLYLITYLSDGYHVKGFLAEPRAAGEYDGFLYLRGGIKNVGMVRAARIAQFASEGFIVFAPFYRGNRGGEGNEDFGGDDRNDAFTGFEVLSNYPNVKQNRVHIFGFSRGGIMALFTGIQFPQAASVVTWGGVSDVALTYVEREDMRRMMKRVIGGTPKTALEKYQHRTPLYELEALKPPVLIIHGERDDNVSVEHAKRLEERLISLDKTVETWYFSDLTHYFPPHINREIVHNLCNWMKNQGNNI
ncbi:alpha/beta hydrolase family protein [Lederbergia graminis]|uniref:Alpha/beta hydrolase family protein n=1 Tax=Lederbergia graminis TaxID=735518 RepID=A0ABW0LLG2_9BACI|nr:prolyl oligopeptidase family serine peptidase [Paenibacillus bovis]HLU21584.1 prolyl oligopeptidase family serine peptidase [Bacillaceae bacterium]